MSNNKNDIISQLMIEFADAIAPLSYLSNQQSAHYLLRQLGYQVPSNLTFNVNIGAFTELPSKVSLLIDAIISESNSDISRLSMELIPKLGDCFDQATTVSNSIIASLQTVPNFINESGIADNLPKRIIDFLIISHVGHKYKKTQSILFALGIFQKQKQHPDPTRFLLETDILAIQWDRIHQLFSNPEQMIKDAFQWSNAAEFITEFVEMGYGELLLILVDFFHSISVPAGIFPYHGDVNLEFAKSRNKELRIPLLRAGTWPDGYSEFGLIIRLYTEVIYIPIESDPIDSGAGAIVSDDESAGDDNFTSNTLNDDSLPSEEDDDLLPETDDEDHDPLLEDFSYLISDQSPLVEKPSIPDPKGIEIQAYVIGNIDTHQEIIFNLGSDWQFRLGFGVGASVNEGVNLILEPEKGFSISVLDGNNRLNARGEILLTLLQGSGQNPKFLFGDANETSLSYLQAGIKSKITTSLPNSYSFDIKVFVQGGKFLLTTNGMDNFLSKVLPNTGIDTDFDITIGWSSEKGVYFEGSGGLEVLVPVHIALGPIQIEGITIALKPNHDDIPIEVSSTLKAELGPLQIVVENIGLSCAFSFPTNGMGKLGPVDFNLGFKPPNGLGLSINAGAVIGGGYLFFEFEKEEYAGALELTIAGFISVKAIGLITTKMPDGSPGFSMLLIITAEFFPPFQLGYGFTLMAVGGLLGLNRTVLLDPLRNGVRTGAVNSIMFPQNVIANAPRIISDLKAIFPPYEGKFLIGPMAKMGWGTPTLISISMGLIIEIPGNIVILGVLAVLLPDKDVPIVKIQVAFSGTIDFDKQMLTFDASLFESSILTMTLEGEMAVRLKWGDSPDFVLTVGGFHPSYTPPPLALPTMRRLAINILNTDIAKIRVECYQAVTPNSVQFGAGADIRFDLEACSIKGHVGFDALFQFSPFYFVITLSANFDLSAFNIDVMTVRVRMSLEGPTPWRAKGTGSVSLLFGEISADFDQTWGEQKNTTLPDIAIFPKLIAELKKKEQWSTVLTSGKNILVSLRKFDEASQNLLILHPAGSLVVQQKLMPLSVDIEKVGNQKTNDLKRAEIASASSSGFPLTVKPVDENFARAQYQILSDAQKLSKPPFEKMPGGVEVSFGENVFKNGTMVRKKVEYELTVIDKEPAKPLPFIETGLLFANFLKGNRVSKSALSKSHAEKLKPFDQKLNVLEEGYTVAFQADNKAYSTKATFASEAMAQSYMQDLIRQMPSLKQQLHIISSEEGYTVAFQANNKAYDTKATFASEAMAQSYMQDLMRQIPSLKQQIHIIPSYELQEA